MKWSCRLIDCENYGAQSGSRGTAVITQLIKEASQNVCAKPRDKLGPDGPLHSPTLRLKSLTPSEMSRAELRLTHLGDFIKNRVAQSSGFVVFFVFFYSFASSSL